jgi:hypothetical protein
VQLLFVAELEQSISATTTLTLLLLGAQMAHRQFGGRATETHSEDATL